MDGSFEERIRALAEKAGLVVAEVTDGALALLIFDMGNGHMQPLMVACDVNHIWEFSCASIVPANEAPAPFLLDMLRENAQLRRGFWCIEKMEGKEVFSHMHNIEESLLTPDEFRTICKTLTERVERFERAITAHIPSRTELIQ